MRTARTYGGNDLKAPHRVQVLCTFETFPGLCHAQNSPVPYFIRDQKRMLKEHSSTQTFRAGWRRNLSAKRNKPIFPGKQQRETPRSEPHMHDQLETRRRSGPLLSCGAELRQVVHCIVSIPTAENIHRRVVHKCRMSEPRLKFIPEGMCQGICIYESIHIVEHCDSR